MAAKYPDDNTNSHVTAIMVVLKVFPQIMKEMICNDFPPQTVIKLIENNKKYKANITEMKMSNLRSNGYDNLEISFLYHIIRSLSLLPEPNQGWGNSPLPEDKNKEDDVERMKNSRNDIIHRRLGDISESMLNEFLKESLEIAKRMDDRIGYPKKFFESKLEQIQSYMVTREKYTEALESLAEYRGKLQETPEGPLFELYYDNNIHMKIVTHEDQDENGDSRSACTIYLRDPSIDAKTVIQNIDAIKEIISKGHYAINLEGAYIGSLKLNVTIRDTSFITKEKLLQTVQSFLHEFFLAASIPFKQGQIYTVVLAESDYLVEDDEKKRDFDYLNENLSPVLKLNVSVKDSAFRNEFVLYREVNSVITGMRNAIKRDNVPSNGSVREALMLADNEFSRSSTPSSTNIQNFQRRLISMATEKDINHHLTALIVVIDVYPQMIREMIVKISPPKFVLMQLQNDEAFMNNITLQQKVMILKLDTEGYNALDLSCLYKVIRNRNLLPKPKQGWGQKPKPEDQSEADDVERMKKIQNDILHRPRGDLSESERNSFFQKSIEIATRVDRRIRSLRNVFKSRIEEIKSGIVTTASPEKYLDVLEKLAECREKLQEKEWPCVILHYANSIAKKIGNQEDQDMQKKDVTVALIKPDVVEAGKVDQMLKDIRKAGIEILRQEERMLTEDEIRHQVYSYLENQGFFEDMVQFMTRSPSFVLALTRGKTGENIIENFRDLIGPTDVDEAKTLKPDSLRAKYGQTSFRNAVHGSSSLEMVKRDLHLFFPDFVAPDVEDKAAKLQTTLALLRPKAVPYKDTILAKIRDSGFKVAMQKEIQMPIEMVKDFYKGHQGQNYYDQLIENMSSGPVLALGLVRENAVEGWRNMLGPKEVSIAKEKAPESLRAQFAEDDTINSLHGSDSQETAKKEIQLFFPTEQTLAVIKPDALRNKKEILARIREAGFRIAITKTTKLSEEVAKKFYANCEKKDYYIDLIEHMKSGEAYFIGMCREDAVEGWRSMMGPSDPIKAKKDSPDSIRATYGENIIKNAVHGSSDPEHAKRSIKTIFGDRSSSCTIVLRDLDFDDEAVMQLKKMALGNICTEDIELIDIEQGSLILHVRIPDWCFMTTEILHGMIYTFLHQFFLVASIPFMHGHIFTVVLAESDDFLSDNELTRAEDLDYLREYTLPIWKFNVNIQDSVFENEFVMHREVNRFFFRMYNAINAHNIPINGSAKEVLMLAANENGENVASSSVNILDSHVR